MPLFLDVLELHLLALWAVLPKKLPPSYLETVAECDASDEFSELRDELHLSGSNRGVNAVNVSNSGLASPSSKLECRNGCFF
jgi:hypothetical protein